MRERLRDVKRYFPTDTLRPDSSKKFSRNVHVPMLLLAGLEHGEALAGREEVEIPAAIALKCFIGPQARLGVGKRHGVSKRVLLTATGSSS